LAYVADFHVEICNYRGRAGRVSLWSGKGSSARVEAETRLWCVRKGASDRNPLTLGRGGRQRSTIKGIRRPSRRRLREKRRQNNSPLLRGAAQRADAMDVMAVGGRVGRSFLCKFELLSAGACQDLKSTRSAPSQNHFFDGLQCVAIAF
jgi:hypothetical protein